MTFGSSFGMGSNLILQWLQQYVIAKAGEACGSRTSLLTLLWLKTSRMTQVKLKTITQQKKPPRVRFTMRGVAKCYTHLQICYAILKVCSNFITMHFNVTVCHFQQMVGIWQQIATHFFPWKSITEATSILILLFGEQRDWLNFYKKVERFWLKVICRNFQLEVSRDDSRQIIIRVKNGNPTYAICASYFRTQVMLVVRSCQRIWRFNSVPSPWWCLTDRLSSVSNLLAVVSKATYC